MWLDYLTLGLTKGDYTTSAECIECYGNHNTFNLGTI